MEIMASTSNAEKLVKIARIVYQLCDYTDFRADFLKISEFAGSGLFSQIRSHLLVISSFQSHEMCSSPIALVR